MPVRYNDSAAVRSITAMHYNDGSAVRDVKRAYYNDGSAVRLVFDKSVQNFVGSFSKYTTFPTTATCIGFIQSDGTTKGQSPENDAGTNWYSPTTVGAGATYYVRLDSVSGTSPSGPGVGVWSSLSTAQSWSVSDSSGSGSSCTLTFSISADQVTVLGTGTFTLYAESSI